MRQYLDLLNTVLQKGERRSNRTGIDALSVFGLQTHYDLAEGFPLLTTKKIFFKGVVHELLWFIAGDTNIKYLVDHKVNIWNEWAFVRYQKSLAYQNETLAEYVQKIKNDSHFAQQHGDLGPIYGYQWRRAKQQDQLQNVIQEIKTNPYSRRLLVDCWNLDDLAAMALPPCHSFFQFYVSQSGTTLNLQLYQRSADLFLGVPFNIASYALLLHLVAKECGLKPGKFVHTLGDAHIYTNHLEQVKLQLSRQPKTLPQLRIKNFKSIFEVQFDDFELINYEPEPAIKGEVAV